MSDFKFPCPHCGTYLSVNTSLIGKKGQCKKCSGVVVVPILSNSTYENNSTIIKKLDWQNFCPICKNFEGQHQVCAKLHFNVQSNPDLFIKNCFGESFELSVEKVKVFREEDYGETKKTKPPPVVTVSKNKTGICPYCRTKIEISDHVHICSYCKTPHHLDCWHENKGCTVYGCKNAPPDEEKIAIDTPITNIGTKPVKNAPGATASLVWGIIGFFLCGLIGGILAISESNKAKKLIQERPDEYKGEGLATAGHVIGIIDLILWGIVLLSRLASIGD